MDRVDEIRSLAIEAGYDPQKIDETLSLMKNVSPINPQETGGNTFSSAVYDSKDQNRPYLDVSSYTYGGTSIGDVPNLTQPFGARHPRYNNISGGVNRGADFGVSEGTPLFAPEGSDWLVVDSYNGAAGKGMQNSGYGNSVVLENTDTGERIRMSHLSGVGVQAGSVIKGGSPIGLSGSTGHATGPHVDVEYINREGRLSDVLQSPYAHQFIK